MIQILFAEACMALDELIIDNLNADDHEKYDRIMSLIELYFKSATYKLPYFSWQEMYERGELSKHYQKIFSKELSFLPTLEYPPPESYWEWAIRNPEAETTHLYPKNPYGNEPK